MASSLCCIRVRLPRSLFRKLMAQAILERTDLSAVVVRAVNSGLPAADRRVRRAACAVAKRPRA